MYRNHGSFFSPTNDQPFSKMSSALSPSSSAMWFEYLSHDSPKPQRLGCTYPFADAPATNMPAAFATSSIVVNFRSSFSEPPIIECLTGYALVHSDACDTR